MFGNGESGTGGVLLGNASLGKAVGVRLGKAVSGIVWYGELGSVSVRQSCLGTFRCGAVKFGEARSGSRGEFGRGLVMHGLVCRVAVWQSRWCKLWRGEVWCVWPGLGSQG